MSESEVRALARAAGERDLVAARRLVRVLERESPACDWYCLGGVYRKGRHDVGPRRVVAHLYAPEFPEAALDAWKREAWETLEVALSAQLQRLRRTPTDAQVVAIWDEPHRRRTSVLLVHPSFELVSEGAEAPTFVPTGGEDFPEWRAANERIRDASRDAPPWGVER